MKLKTTFIHQYKKPLMALTIFQLMLLNAVYANSNNDYLNDVTEISNAFKLQHNGDSKIAKRGLNEFQKKAFNDANFIVDNQQKPTEQMMIDVREIKDHAKDIATTTIDSMSQSIVKKKGKLFYFISFSMPDKLIKGYIKEAIWSGGTIVFNGLLPEYDKLITFLREKIYPYVNYAGVHPDIDINSSTYQKFGITEVPAVVYSVLDQLPACIGERQANGYVHCQLVDNTQFWKMTGTVSTYYALEAFAESGAPVAEIIDKYKKMTGGINTDKEIKTYDGNLEDLPQPYPKEYINNVLAGMGLAQGKNGIIGEPDIIAQYEEKGKTQGGFNEKN